MALYATYSSVNVNGVVEIGVVRNLVNASPWDGSALREETVSILVFSFAQ